MLACLFAAPAFGAAQAPTVLVTRVDDTITPVVADHLAEGLRTAERERHAAYVVEVDTPGGLLQSTGEIVQDFLASDVPVVVHVTPPGARAASAGAHIAMASHVAAMAPGTHIGARTPVTGQGEEASDKVVNDSVAFAVSIAEQRGRNTRFAEDMVRRGTAVSDQEAGRTDVVDLVAPSREALLTELDGRRVVVGPADAAHEVVPHTAGAQVVEHDLGFFGELRQLLASPELAFLFLSIGTLAVIYELAGPGMGLGGVAGAILLVPGFVALSVLPFSVGGLLLLALAAALFVAEVLTPGVGICAAGGRVAGVRRRAALPRRAGCGSRRAVAHRRGGGRRRNARRPAGVACPPGPRHHRARGAAGLEAVVRRADARTGTGQVLLEGAWWTVRGREAPITLGQRVRVVKREGLNLIVEGTDPEEGRDTEQEDGS
ncbi:NfeD family protein [Streptomyces sp. NPDC006368]|uniref:NfeD family protein n=1 Tax=Streptomyces sp. NPDC006368 TaxID=3156760 RepID=UPI0033AF08EE